MGEYLVLTSYNPAVGNKKWRLAPSLGRAATLASQLSTNECIVTIMEWKPIALTTEQLVVERKRILAEIDRSLSNELEKILQGEES